MSTVPSTLIIGSIPNGLQVLEDHSLQTDTEGVSRATARFFCYPPNANLRPAHGSSHPRYPGLRLESCEVRLDGFMFFDCTYVGLLGGPVDSTEAESHVRTGYWLAVNDDGSMAYKQYAIKNTVTRRNYITAGSAPEAAPGAAVSYQRIGNITRYSIETTTETRTLVE